MVSVSHFYITSPKDGIKRRFPQTATMDESAKKANRRTNKKKKKTMQKPSKMQWSITAWISYTFYAHTKNASENKTNRTWNNQRAGKYIRWKRRRLMHEHDCMRNIVKCMNILRDTAQEHKHFNRFISFRCASAKQKMHKKCNETRWDPLYCVYCVRQYVLCMMQNVNYICRSERRVFAFSTSFHKISNRIFQEFSVAVLDRHYIYRRKYARSNGPPFMFAVGCPYAKWIKSSNLIKLKQSNAVVPCHWALVPPVQREKKSPA